MVKGQILNSVYIYTWLKSGVWDLGLCMRYACIYWIVIQQNTNSSSIDSILYLYTYIENVLLYKICVKIGSVQFSRSSSVTNVDINDFEPFS